MKIEFKSDNTKMFKEIKDEIGTCFEYNGIYCVIIPPVFQENDAAIIAFNLIANDFIYDDEINGEDIVRILDLKLVEE